MLRLFRLVARLARFDRGKLLLARAEFLREVLGTERRDVVTRGNIGTDGALFTLSFQTNRGAKFFDHPRFSFGIRFDWSWRNRLAAALNHSPVLPFLPASGRQCPD